MNNYKIPTALLLPLILLLPSLRADPYDLARFWELRVSDAFNEGEAHLATQRFIDELRITESQERKIRLIQTFQRIVAERSDHYPTDSLYDDETRWELLSTQEQFAALSIELETTREAIASQIAVFREKIGLKNDETLIKDELVWNHREALFALEALRILRDAIKGKRSTSWKNGFERAIRLNDYYGALAAGLAAIDSANTKEEKLTILKEIKDRFEQVTFTAGSSGTDYDFYQRFAAGMVVDNLAFLEFVFDEENRVNNAEQLRWRIIHGVAPRTDVPTISDIRKFPSVVLTLRIIEAISGEPDPILERARRDGLI